MKHRQERVQRLMEAVKGFVDIGQLCRISVALMKISSDFKAVEDARQRPAIPTRHERREKLKSNRNGQGNFHSHHSIGIVASHSAVPFPYLR